MSGFQQYMDNTLQKINLENKEIYLAGDFNTDFLKIDTNNSYQEFYNSITSSGFLPQIIQPTRVTEHSSTVIDNIYTNTFRNDMVSGNILLCMSEHFCQFLVKVLRKLITTKEIIPNSRLRLSEMIYLSSSGIATPTMSMYCMMIL